MDNNKFKLVKYPKGAYILIEGEDNRGEFFIIKEGKVSIYNPHFIENDVNPILGPGDFFGVIPCMARRTNMETIQTLTDVIAISVRQDQFAILIEKNVNIALKMIKYLSKELRYYDELLGKVLKNLPAFSEETQEDILYNLGNYYLKRGELEKAFIAFKRFIEQSNNSNLKEDATLKLQKISKVSLKEPKREGKNLIFEGKQLIFLEGEVGHELYVIQEGRVKITKFLNDEEVLLDILKKGDIFGEMAIIENKPRNASAFSEGDVKLMAIRKEDFENIVKTFPTVATKIIELLSERIWVIYRQLMNMFITTPEIKIYDALYTQLLKNRVNLEEKKEYAFSFGTEDLLKYVGLANEEGYAVWREIRTRDKNIVITPAGKIKYLDVSKLNGKINFILREKEIRENKKKFSQIISEKI